MSDILALSANISRGTGPFFRKNLPLSQNFSKFFLFGILPELPILPILRLRLSFLNGPTEANSPFPVREMMRKAASAERTALFGNEQERKKLTQNFAGKKPEIGTSG